MDWDNVRIFLAVARAGQFAAAAKQLGLGQATLSRRVAALGAAVGAKLFDPSTTGAKLTGAGERFLGAAEQMEGALLRAQGEISGVQLERSGDGAAQRWDWQKTISDFLIVTIPGVLLYFTGWAYLSSYLASFGIDPSELKLDTATILVYSYPPISDFITTNWHSVTTHWFAAILIVLSVVTLIHLKLNRILPSVLPQNVRKTYQYLRPISQLSPSVRIVYLASFFLIAALLMLSFILRPISYEVAAKRVQEVWSLKSTRISFNTRLEDTAVETKTADEAKVGKPSPDQILKQDAHPNGYQWITRADNCQNEGKIVSVFSDYLTLFAFCKTDKVFGQVFEFRKEKGLISVREVIAVKGSPNERF